MNAYIDENREMYVVELNAGVLPVALLMYWRHAALLRDPSLRRCRTRRDEHLMMYSTGLIEEA